MKYGIWCTRGAASMFGPAVAWMKNKNNEQLQFDTRNEAETYLNTIKTYSRNVNYTIMPIRM